MTGDSPARCGLRERKKQATRRALHDAAVRLALDEGLEHLTVEEISAAADVSVRTFFNYFPSKEQAILGDDVFPADEGQTAALMAGASSVLEGLHRVAIALAADTSSRREQVLMRWQLMERYPALIPQMFARLQEFEKVLASAVASRTGDAADDAYPQLMAALATTSMRTAVRRWTARHGDHAQDYHMDEMFTLLRNAGQPGHVGQAGPLGQAG